jgi:hypothetical protein
VSVKTPIWSWGFPLNAFKKLPVKLPVMVTQSSRSRQLMGRQVATVLSLKKPTQGDCPQHQDDAGQTSPLNWIFETYGGKKGSEWGCPELTDSGLGVKPLT